MQHQSADIVVCVRLRHAKLAAGAVLVAALLSSTLAGVAHATNATIVPIGEQWQLLLLAEPLPWQAAEHFCVKYGGHLVSISNQTEEDLVEQSCFAMLGAVKCWIGLNDILDEGHYVFSDDTPFNYTSWYKAPWSRRWESQPNDHLNWAQEDCVLLQQSKRGWHDEHCNDAHPFICRRPTPPPPPLPPTPSAHHTAGQPTTGNVSLQEPPTPEQAAAAAVTHSQSHLLLWGLLGGVVGGLVAFEGVYLVVIMYRKHSGNWSGWRPTFDAVRIVKQVEMMSAADEDDDEFGVPDLVEAPPNWREAVGMRMRAAWARAQGLFGRRYSELPE